MCFVDGDYPFVRGISGENYEFQWSEVSVYVKSGFEIVVRVRLYWITSVMVCE